METKIMSKENASVTRSRPIRKAAVLGAGVMGAQIAAHLTNAGLEVLLLDIAPEKGPANLIIDAAFKRLKKMNPAPFFSDRVVRRIRTGNFRDDFHLLAGVDWVIEAVVENMQIKQDLMAKIERVVSEGTIVSTNTSGLPIHQIAEGRSDSFKAHFLGTHFFNPPRYLKLLELIPTVDTDANVVEQMAEFGRIRLGKGVVVAKDTPNFIGNRIGVYAMIRAARELANGYSIEEIDELTGTLIGRPKSATFRTADVVGLDTLKYVADNLYENIPEDESREIFRVPELIGSLVSQGKLGAKTKAGFYKKVGSEIHSVDPETLEYRVPEDKVLPDLERVVSARGIEGKMRALFESDGRAGQFFRQTTLDILAYSARRIPEISDSPADVDRAMRWGFGWSHGPFEIWDVLGFEAVLSAMETADLDLPEWIHKKKSEESPGFYKRSDGFSNVYVPKSGFVAEPTATDTLSLAEIGQDPSRRIWSNDDANLWDIGDQVALFEFRSKANSLGATVMGGLNEALDIVENGDWRGMVIGNEGKNFSVGANLGEMVMAMMMGQFDVIDEMLGKFQSTIQRVRYSPKPVVTAVHQRVLGGGCEMTMASAYPVLSAETYIGLVELGVGLIPAGCGTMRMTAWAAERAPTAHPSDIQTLLRQYFERIAMAKVATSGEEARAFGLVPEHAIVVMNDDRRLYVAKSEVVRLSQQGYAPPVVHSPVRVLGKPAKALFEAALHQFRQGQFISDYDQYLASRLATVMTGGEIEGPMDVSEQYLLDLERETFLSLLGEEKTQARIESILTTNKPLRN